MSEKGLIKAIKKGDHQAFKEVFDRYASTFMGIAWRYAGNEPDAQDILQDAFVRIYQKIGGFKGKGSFEGWMKRIVVSTAINHINKRKREGERMNNDEVEDLEIPDEKIPDDMGEEDLLNALDELPDGYRMVFNLVVIEGYEHKEIAEKLGITPGTSQSQLFKAKKMLRRKLAFNDHKVPK